MPGQFDKLPIALDTTYLEPNVTPEMVKLKQDLIREVDHSLRSGACPGCEFTGWLKPDKILGLYELLKLKSTAERLERETDVLLVIGIGGSYLGARAVVEALSENPERVVYAGHNLSAHYMTRLKARLAGKKVAVNVVSKSGTTTEPAVAFRVVKELLEKSIRKEWVVATTDLDRGALLRMAKKAGYETMVVPDDIGGRYSTLSAVGLLPAAYAGVDVDAMISGAKTCADLCSNTDPTANPAYYYAAARNILYSQGTAVEILASFEPRLHYFAEWWKQLFGESQGKENMALYPASVDFTTDLHSLGQYIQEGRRILAETFLIIDEGEPSIEIPLTEDDADGLNYLVAREVSYVNSMAYKATAKAHRDGGIPNMTVHLKKLDAFSLGALIYFFEIACAVDALMLGVNPFDQPGVEAYKTEMFKLLGKPGFKLEEGEERERTYIQF
ncbi:MAG: glucose-6-phosphate isomerase [Armatimonadetes bacterium]|nr:glucose-6-phosphate isomerase [Armatimonadota bacterium]